ncbi:MAG: thiamine pyrophosphate-binding protein [Clostridia bacterium]|nr:thiamine pyrophosphate-binding protein [Clostridia bacterium]
MIKLSEYIFKFLKEKQVQHIFMVPGGGAMHLVDSLGNSEIEYVCCQHEQAAAIAAEAYGQHSNHLGVALVTSGPGGTNTITGVAAGWIDSTPMMIISGQAKRQDLIGSKGVRQIGSQEVTIIEIVEPITKYAVQIYDPTMVCYYLEKAYYEATTGRKGPVWLDIPLDVQAAMIEPDQLKHFIPELDSTDEDIETSIKEIIQKLKKSKKPLILAGNGIYSSDSVDEFHELLQKVQIPVQTTWKSIDVMWDKHPLYAGHPGGLGDRGANFIIQECDLLITLGARLDNSITAFNELEFAPNAYKIVVDIDKNELHKFVMRIDLPICCNVKHLIKHFNKAMENEEPILRENWTSHCNELREKYPIITKQHEMMEDYVSGYYFTGLLSDVLGEDDIIVPESAGVTVEATIQAFRNKKGQKIKHAAGLGSMGFGLPYSIGACLANEGRRTILINGDGAFQLNIQELETIHRLQLPVKIFIWNNQGYASIRGMQRNNFKGHYVASEIHSGMTLPNISRVAEAYGLSTFQIHNNSEIKEVIDQVLTMEGPTLCELILSPDEIVAPKVQAKIGKDGNMIPGKLDCMWPFIDNN